MRVYVITKGEYSDYHICAVTLDKDRAELLAEKYGSRWDKAYIEEFDTEATEDITTDKDLYYVHFEGNGDVYKVEAQDGLNRYDLENPVTSYWCGNNGLLVKCLAKNDKAAIKIAAEKRAKYLAEKAGL